METFRIGGFKKNFAQSTLILIIACNKYYKEETIFFSLIKEEKFSKEKEYLSVFQKIIELIEGREKPTKINITLYNLKIEKTIYKQRWNINKRK